MGPTRQQLIDRAAFDLKCDPSQIRVTELDSRTRGVNACGQQVTYVDSCQNHGVEIGTKSDRCTWVLNSDSKSDKKSAKE